MLVWVSTANPFPMKGDRMKKGSIKIRLSLHSFKFMDEKIPHKLYTISETMRWKVKS